MPGLFDHIPIEPQPQPPPRGAGLFDHIPIDPSKLSPLAARPDDDPVAAEVRAELRAERVKEALEEQRRHEEFKAGETPWYELLRPYPGKFKPLTPEQKAAEGKSKATQSMVAQGATMGLADELGAIVAIPGEMISRGTLNPLTAYDYAKTRRNIELEEDRKESGGAGILGEIGGGLATGVGAVKTGATWAPRIANSQLTRNAPGWLKNLLGRSADAATFGGAYGLASGESVGERLQEGGQGAILAALLGAPKPSTAVGAGLGAASGAYYSGGDPLTTGLSLLAGGYLGPKVARSVGNYARAKTDPRGVAGEALAAPIIEGGRTIDDVGLGMRRAARDQYGDSWTVADETAPQTRGVMMAVAQTPTPTRQTVYQTLVDRQSGQRERLVFELERLANERKTAQQVFTAKDAERRATNKETFAKAQGDAGTVDVRPVIDKIDEHIYVGAKPTRPELTEGKAATLLGDTLADYPVPGPKSSAYYKAAYEGDLLGDIEAEIAKGTPDKGISAFLESRLPNMRGTDRTKMVGAVKSALGVPSPSDPSFPDWQMATLDRLIAREQAAKVRGFSEAPNDEIAGVLREVRSLFEDKGQSIEKFAHVWRARENLSNIIQRVGLDPPVLGKDPTYNATGIKLKEVREAIDAALADASPTYKEAMKKAHEGQKVLKAITKGDEWAVSGRSKDNIPAYKKMSPDERAGARTGYISKLAGRIEASEAENQLGKISSPKRQAELRAIAPTRGRANRFDRARERERTMWDTFMKSFGGSQTAARTEAVNKVPELLNPEVISSLLMLQPLQAAKNAMMQGRLLAQGYTPSVSDEILKMQMARPGAEWDAVSEQLQRSTMGAEARKRMQAELLRLGYSGTAPSLSD